MTGCAVVLTQGIVATLQVAAAESPEQSHICYLLPTCYFQMVLPFVQSMHQTGVNQMREMHTRLLLQAHAREEEGGCYLKGPERQFARLDCWQARVNGGSHNNGQNCQNDNDPHSGC